MLSPDRECCIRAFSDTQTFEQIFGIDVVPDGIERIFPELDAVVVAAIYRIRRIIRHEAIRTVVEAITDTVLAIAIGEIFLNDRPREEFLIDIHGTVFFSDRGYFFLIFCLRNRLVENVV